MSQTPNQPDHLSVVVEVINLRTTTDGGIRVTLEFGEGHSNEAAWLIDAKNSGVALQAAFVKISNGVIGLPSEDEADEADEDNGLPTADEIIGEIERKGQ